MDLHTHSNFSDGYSDVGQLVRAAVEKRLRVIAITDHFWPSHGARRGGLSVIHRRRAVIEGAREDFNNIMILDGAEVDINLDGTLAEVAGGLDQFDIVIGSVHRMCSSRAWASCVTRVLGDREFDILGHWDGYLTSYSPSDGRLVAECLASNEVAIELNASYSTENTEFLGVARDLGCVFTLGSDAHSASDVGRLHEQLSLARALELPLVNTWPPK